MWSFICALIVLSIQHSYAFPSLELLLELDQCDDVNCPQLSCLNPVLKEGDCCKSCITKGRNLTKYCSYTYVLQLCVFTYLTILVLPLFTEEGCLKDEIHYKEQSVVPSGSDDACEICHCCVRHVNLLAALLCLLWCFCLHRRKTLYVETFRNHVLN